MVLIEVYISHALGMSSFDQSEEAITFDGTVPSHFYGELTKTYEGCEFLAEKGHFADFAEFIRRHGFENSDTDLISKLKSVLWAVGTIGSTPHGLPFLEHERIIGTIVEIAERNEFISVKGTCYFVLGLIASTEAGITILERFGWQSTVSTLGQPLGICLPKNLNKFVHIPEWEAYTNRHVQSAFVLEEPTKPIERQIIGVLSDLSNQLVAGGASRSLAKLKAQDKAPFRSITMLSRALYLMETFHYRAPARKCILDAFDIEFNDSTVRAVMKASQLLKDGGKDVNVDLHATEMAEMKWREELSDIINDEVGVLLKKKYNTAEFNEKNLLAASMDSDQESADVRKVRDIRGDKVEKLEPINTVIGGFGSETSQPARQPRLQE